MPLSVKMRWFHLLLAMLVSLVHVVQGNHYQKGDLNATLLPVFDYVVVGCGVSGLVVANRLSEDNGLCP